MDLGDRLQRWWDRVRGYEPPTARPVTRPARQTAGPAAARPISALEGMAEDEPLRLSVAEQPPEPDRPQGPGEAGYDPYSNAAGHRKPRGWDNAPRK